MAARLDSSQAIVLGFSAAAWLALGAIAVLSPATYRQTFGATSPHLPWPAVALGAGGAMAILAVGVLRRWTWVFWVVLLAFLAGGLRVPLALLQLAGTLGTRAPHWFVALQGALGAAQVAIGIVLLRTSRRAGAWGSRVSPDAA